LEGVRIGDFVLDPTDLTYFDRHVNYIKFIRTSSESDMQHNNVSQKCFKRIVFS